MSSLCGELSAGFQINCDAPLIAGANDRLILLNQDDIDVVTRDPSDNDVILDITLKSGKQGYVYEGQNRSVEPAMRLVKSRYSDNFDHEVIFKIFGDNSVVKKQIKNMVAGTIVAIVETNYRGVNGEAAFHVFGLEGGLDVAEMERVIADADTEGSYSLTLRSSEFAREPALPNTWFDTDYNTTKGLVDALASAPVVFNVSPLVGSTAGGDTFQITGEGFTGATAVDWMLGGVPTSEPGFVVTDDNTIDIAASAALSAGTYSLQVTTPNGMGCSLPIIVIS